MSGIFTGDARASTRNERWIIDSSEIWPPFRHKPITSFLGYLPVGCELCSLFSQVINQANGLWSPPKDGTDVVIRVDSAYGVWDSTDAPGHWKLLFKYPSGAYSDPIGFFELVSLYENQSYRYVTHLPESLSETSISKAASWLKDCSSGTAGHEICARRIENVLPSRVIDVGLSGNPKIKLYTTNASSAPYIALSHCWGGRIRTVLTNASVASFEEGIPPAQLPRNFLDAISITRRLGFRYLWIDALCIMQDDELDWARESAAMAGVYQNAAFILSASTSYNSEVGLAFRRNARLTVDQGLNISLGSIFLQETHQATKLDWPILQRGWTLQEHVLAPAVFNCARAASSWECRSKVIWEHGPEERSHPIMKQLDLMLARYPETDEIDLNTPVIDAPTVISSAWYSLAQTYSGRKLTVPSDKIAALAGLATWFASDQFSHLLLRSSSKPPTKGHDINNKQGPNNDNGMPVVAPRTYVAGLWLEDLIFGLCWYCPAPAPTSSLKPLEPSRAPSWSWLSIDNMVQWPERGYAIDTQGHARIVRHELDYRTTARALGGRIVLCGMLSEPRAAASNGDACNPIMIGETWSREYLDRAAMAYQALYLVTYKRDAYDNRGNYNPGVRSIYLLLEKVDGIGDAMEEPVYRRVGLAIYLQGRLEQRSEMTTIAII